jgi:uncharacterized protein
VDQSSEQAFLGKGWTFPPRLEPDGSTSMVAFEEDIHQSIHIILGTNPGERIMRPDFGAGLRDFVFEPINTTTMTRVRKRVREALIDWEPRIDLDEVQVEADRGARNKLLVAIRYRVRASNTLHNLVYPFYLQEGTAR